MEIGKTNFKVPSPGEYSFRSDFDSKKGITISAGREVIRANSAFEIPKPYPGPGQYDPKHMSLGEAEKDKGVALRSRQPDNSQKWLNSVPGPGNYETLELLNKSLKSSNSRITNAKSVRFSKSKRESDFEAGIKNKIPGPGNCTHWLTQMRRSPTSRRRPDSRPGAGTSSGCASGRGSRTSRRGWCRGQEPSKIGVIQLIVFGFLALSAPIP